MRTMLDSLTDETWDDPSSEVEMEEEFSASTLPPPVREALTMGLWPLAVQRAIDAGIRDDNTLTNMIFFAVHPERGGRALSPSEPGFSKLAEEWKGYRSFFVQPALKASPPSAGPAAGAGGIEDRTMHTSRDKRKGTRPVSGVDALVLHQMAFSRGNDLKRYDSVTAHFVITPDGKIAQLHPVTAKLWASNGFNSRSVAVEFAGNFPSTSGKCWNAAKFGCHKVTPAQIAAGRKLVGHLKKTIGITHIFAHRQSSASRANDPGPDVWCGVGEWAIRRAGLTDGGPTYKIDSGNPIPAAWRTWCSV
jgi:hypothetical protein